MNLQETALDTESTGRGTEHGGFMKEAKKRISPLLKKLLTSTRRADRAMKSGLAYVSKSTRRILRKHLAAVHEMRRFMRAAPSNEGIDIRSMIDEGRA